MLGFIVRRIFYSLLILVGVLLLSFLLFDVAAGDPAAAVLGKNASASEIESLRRELGADLPLFYGRRCVSEAFGAYAEGRPTVRGVTVSPRGGVRFQRNFPSEILECEVRTSDGAVRKQLIAPTTASVSFGGKIRSVRFFRLQDSPWNSRFLRSLGEVFSITAYFPFVKVLDFGRTISTREPIRDILLRGVGPSLSLMLPVFLGELVIGVGLALLAAAFKDRWPDRMLVLLSVAGMSVSYLVLIIFGQWFLGYYFDWFPVWGFESWKYLVLPILVGIASGLGGNVRFYRTVFVNELNREYLRTATAKGCSPFRLYARHLLRNAAIQIVTRASASLPFLFTGSLLLESFFGIPGLGFAGVDALYNSDIQLLKALVVTSALLFVFINLLADLAYGWADPRVRL